MDILIKYCAVWNFKPKAVSLADSIKKKFKNNVLVEPGYTGEFRVFINGKVIFDKNSAGRFPEPDEVESKIKNLIWPYINAVSPAF